MTIKRAVIAAAGMGTRFLPATKSQPKEMLPIVDKPSIQYIVEEAVASGINEIIIVTGRNKRAIEDHFDYSFELSEHLKNKGKTKALAEIEEIEGLAKIIYVRQPKPLGDGDAILCAKEFLRDEPFAVLFGDDIYDSPTPALAQLIECYEKTKTPVIGLHKIEKSESNKYGVIDGKEVSKDLFGINSLVEKPAPEDAPSNLAICGKYIVTPELLKDLETSSSHTNDNEIRLIDGMKNYIKHSKIHGYNINGVRFDTGDKLGYLKSVIHFGLKHDTLSQDFKKHLQSLELN